MKKLLLAIPAVLLLATSCTTPSVAGVGGDKQRGCADKLIQQETSNTVVKGTFSCLASDVQNAARAYAISNDELLAQALAPGSGDSAYRYIEKSKDGGYVYEVSKVQDSKVVVDTYVIVYVQNNSKSADYGKVIGIKATQ